MNSQQSQSSEIALVTGQCDPKYYTSIDIEKRSGRKIIMQCISGQCERLRDKINQQITVSDLFCQEVEIDREDSQGKVRCPRVVLITPDAEMYETVSVGVSRDVAAITWMYGPPPWDPPVVVVPRTKTIGKSGKSVMYLEIVE